MKQYILYLFLVFLFGCALPKKALPDDLTLNPIKLPLFIEEVTVIDKRGPLKSMDWNIKTLTLKNQTYEGNPELSSEHIETIKQIFMNASTPNATPAKLTFYLEIGNCVMKHHYTEQSSLTKIKGNVLIDVYPRDSKYKGYAELQYTYSHPNVNKVHILQMYHINIKNVCHNILQLMRDQLNNN